MRIQYNEQKQVIGYGEIYGEMTAEVEPIEGNYFDFDYINGQLIKTRNSKWHEPEFNIQIKLTHYTNTKLLAKYPEMAQFAKVLPVHTDFTHVYMYCNRIEDSDYAKLKEFDIEINPLIN